MPIDVVVKDMTMNSPINDTPLSESLSNTPETPAVEDLQAPRKPHEFPDVLEPVAKLDNNFDVHPEEIVTSEVEEPVLQYMVHDRSPGFPFVANL